MNNPFTPGPQRFTVNSEPPTPVTEPNEADFDLSTATRWTVHLRCRFDGPVVGLADLDRLVAGTIVADYIGGDSWHEWAEPAKPNEDLAVHVAFKAADVKQARAIAWYVAGFFGLNPETDTALSTAGDWSQQTPMA